MEKTEEKIKMNPKKKKRLMMIIGILVICVGILVYFWNQYRMDSMTKYWFDKAAKDGTLEGKSPAEIQEMLNKIVEEGMFNVTMNVAPVFENGEGPGNLGIENIKENRYYCKVTMTLDEDKTVLYESAGIKPGQYIDEITLNKDLPKGEHPCTAKFIATDPQTLDNIGQVNVKVNLTIMN